jgi:hypothetical protein
MQIKTTMRYYFIPIRMFLLKEKKQKITSVGEDVDILEILCIVSGNVKWCKCYGKQNGGYSKS